MKETAWLGPFLPIELRVFCFQLQWQKQTAEKHGSAHPQQADQCKSKGHTVVGAPGPNVGGRAH